MAGAVGGGVGTARLASVLRGTKLNRNAHVPIAVGGALKGVAATAPRAAGAQHARRGASDRLVEAVATSGADVRATRACMSARWADCARITAVLALKAIARANRAWCALVFVAASSLVIVCADRTWCEGDCHRARSAQGTVAAQWARVARDAAHAGAVITGLAHSARRHAWSRLVRAARAVEAEAAVSGADGWVVGAVGARKWVDGCILITEVAERAEIVRVGTRCEVGRVSKKSDGARVERARVEIAGRCVQIQARKIGSLQNRIGVAEARIMPRHTLICSIAPGVQLEVAKLTGPIDLTDVVDHGNTFVVEEGNVGQGHGDGGSKVDC